MKEQILEIAEKLRLELITEYEARTLLLGLFGVIKCDEDELTECDNCGYMVKMISIGEFCPHCFC